MLSLIRCPPVDTGCRGGYFAWYINFSWIASTEGRIQYRQSLSSTEEEIHVLLWEQLLCPCVCYTPANEVWGYIGITLSGCLSVRLSVSLSRVNFTLAITFQPNEIRLSHMFAPCDKTFLWVPKLLILWPWP